MWHITAFKREREWFIFVSNAVFVACIYYLCLCVLWKSREGFDVY